MSDVTNLSCTACGKALAPHVRRCPACGSWVRPWSVGGKPSRSAAYAVGGAGRQEDAKNSGERPDTVGSVWVRYGQHGEYVRQSTPSGEAAPSGGRSIRRRRKK